LGNKGEKGVCKKKKKKERGGGDEEPFLPADTGCPPPASVVYPTISWHGPTSPSRYKGGGEGKKRKTPSKRKKKGRKEKDPPCCPNLLTSNWTSSPIG